MWRWVSRTLGFHMPRALIITHTAGWSWFSFFRNCNAINTSIGYVCAGCGMSSGFKVKHWYEVLKPYSVGHGKVLIMFRQL